METVKKTHQRSRSRSKTPTTEAQYRTTRSGRKTPVGISTNQLLLIDDSIIVEESEDMFTSPPAHRTRNMTKQTSDYSSEEPDTSPERVTSLTKEELQNIKNYSYNEHIYTTRSEKSDTIQSTQDVTRNYSRSRASPSQSDSSFKSSFAELTLADVSRIKETDPSDEYLPYKLYKYAGEYWNKYPKTDYTYSTYSKDYVELAPGQPAMPNMSRRSLHNFRLYGTSTDTEEVDYISTSSAMADSLLKKSWNNYEGIRNRLNYQEDAQPLFNGMKYKYPMQNGEDERYWFTRILINIWTKIVTTVTTTTNNNTTDIDLDLYPYYYGNQSAASSAGASFLSRIGSALAAPFIYATSFISHYTSVKSVSTATRFLVSPIRKRKFWYFLIPLLLLLAWSRSDYDAPALRTFRVENVHRHIVEIFGLQSDYAVRPKFAENDVVGWINAELERRLVSLKQELAAQIKASEQNHQATMEKMSQSLKMELAAWQKNTVEDIHHRISISSEESKDVNVIYKHDEVRIRRIIAEMLAIYDADKTGRVDYALESAGGQIISIRCTESYQARTAQISILGVPIWWPSNTPRIAITPGTIPGECWAFQSFPGYLVIRLFAAINVTGFTMEHVQKSIAPEGKIESAPRNFTVWGLLSELDTEPHKFGDYMYDENATAIQYFPVQQSSIVEVSSTARYPVAYDLIELRIETNYGNPTYTCLYRFRIHGDKVDKYIPTQNGNTRSLENR